MPKVKLIFGTINTLPAADISQFESAYQTAIKPFLTSFYNSSLSATLYYSGRLLEWLTKNHPEFHSVLTELSENKAVDILGGPWWEPLLPLIPSQDRVSQIEKMTTDIRQKFGRRPRGVLLTANIWESSLATSLAKCGMGFMFLSSRCFSTISDFDSTTPLITEDQGKSVVIFPIYDSLTCQLVKVPPESIIDSLKKIGHSANTDLLISLLVDGMVFANDGIQWLEHFFKVIKANCDWLECHIPSDFLINCHSPKRLVYLPTPSYNCLMKWNGNNNPDNTSWRDFLLRYKESAFLYSKMKHTNVLANQVRKDKFRKLNAKEEIWKAQEHYAYWYGAEGGIYNPQFRYNTYKALIESEKITREKGIFKPALTAVDFDMDGEKEYLFSGSAYNAYVHLTGAVLFELDYLSNPHNYLATFSRYVEDGISENCDSTPRHAFMDFILRPIDDVRHYRQTDNLAGKAYALQDMNREHPSIRLSVQCAMDDNETEVKLEKNYRFHRKSLEINYTVTNNSTNNLEFLLASEINLALSESSENRRIFLNTDKVGEFPASEEGVDGGIDSWLIDDRERQSQLHFSLSEPVSLWRYPLNIKYHRKNEICDGYECNTFLPWWNVNLNPLECRQFGITLSLI